MQKADLHTNEVRAGTGVFVIDRECLSRELRQRAVGVVEKLQGLVTRVGDDGSDLEVVDAIDSTGAADLNGKTRGCLHCDSRADKSQKSGADCRGEHGQASRGV